MNNGTPVPGDSKPPTPPHDPTISLLEEEEAKPHTSAADEWYSPMARLRIKRQKHAKNFLRETVFYFLWLTLVCVVISNGRSRWSYYLTEEVRNAFLKEQYQPWTSWLTIASVSDVLSWSEKIFFPTLFPTKAYSGAASELPSTEQRYTMSQSLRLGAVRWRQLRVAPKSNCADKKFDFLSVCYPEYTSKTESVDAFGTLPQYDPMSKAFRYTPRSEVCPAGNRMCGVTLRGAKGNSYPQTGFVWDFKGNRTQSLHEMSVLVEQRWLDLQSRALIMEFNLYNPNGRQLMAVQLLFEFHPTGNVISTYSIKSLSFLSPHTKTEWFLFMCEIFLLATVVMYVFGETIEIYEWQQDGERCPTCIRKRNKGSMDAAVIPCFECEEEFNHDVMPCCPRCGREVPLNHQCWRGYFQDRWNLLDITNYFFFLLVLGIRFDIRRELAKKDFSGGIGTSPEFVQVYGLAWLFALTNWLNAVNAALCFFKTFKYLGKFKTLSGLVRTVSYAKTELVFFSAIFAVIFGGFALGFHLAYGTDLTMFKDWPSALQSLFRYLLGDFVYSDLQTRNRILAPLFFVSYEVLTWFILANMFIAIISSAYERARDDIDNARDDFLASSLKLFVNDFKMRLSRLGLVRPNSQLLQVDALLRRMAESDELTDKEKANIVSFCLEVEHDPENTELFTEILREFNGKIDRPMGHSDYVTLRRAVLSFRKSQAKAHRRIASWQEELQRTRSATLSPGTTLSRISLAAINVTGASRKGSAFFARVAQVVVKEAKDDPDMVPKRHLATLEANTEITLHNLQVLLRMVDPNVQISQPLGARQSTFNF